MWEFKDFVKLKFLGDGGDVAAEYGMLDGEADEGFDDYLPLLLREGGGVVWEVGGHF